MPGDAIDELAKRAQGGDRAAFRQIVVELEADLRMLLGALEVTEGLAEEIVQATFVTAWQKLDTYRGEGAFRAWLKAIARNHLFKTLREQKRFTEATGDVLEGALVQSGMDDFDRMDELQLQTRKLRSCMERLSGPIRALVDGRYVEGLSSARLASRLERTEIWVRVTLCRARQSLRRCMEAQAES